MFNVVMKIVKNYSLPMFQSKPNESVIWVFLKTKYGRFHGLDEDAFFTQFELE